MPDYAEQAWCGGEYLRQTLLQQTEHGRIQ
jgi:hypothetical protein